MKISILIFEGCSTISPLGAYDLLLKANGYARSFYEQNGNTPLFDVQLVGVHRKKVAGVGGIAVHAHRTIKEINETDLVLIPALDDRIEEGIEENKDCIPWLQKMFDQGADLTSICTGAFILAETGLLDYKRCTTHWITRDLFRQRYPKIKLCIDKIIVDEGRICSSGGAASFLNLILYLIEKYGSKDISVFCSKIFLVDINKSNQNSYAIFGPQKNHHDNDILKVQQYIESNFAKPINLEKLSDLAYSSTRNFIRRFKKATGNTPSEYIQRVRVEAAKRDLESSSKTVGQIVLNVGYEDVPYFRKLFQKYTGLSMRKYRDRYQIMN